MGGEAGPAGEHLAGERLLRRGARYLPAVVVLLLFGHLAWFVFRSVVDAPFMDEWFVWSALLRAIDDHTLSWQFLFSSYNGHRIAFVRALLLALLPTRWSVYPQVAFTLLVSVLALLLVWRLYRRTSAELGIRASPWVAVVLAALVFSGADMNRLWGMGHQWHVVTAATIATFVLTSTRPLRWWRLALAAVTATVATTSTGAGLLAWPLAAPLIWLAAARPGVRWRAVACWSIAAALVWAAYLHGLPELAGGRAMGSMGSAGSALAHPLESLRFVLIYLGQPLQVRYSIGLMLSLGVIGLLLGAAVTIACGRCAPLVPLAPWLAMAAFAAASGAMIATARYGTHVALYYITTGRVYWIALAALACTLVALVGRDGGARWMGLERWALVVLVAASLTLNAWEFRAAAEEWRVPREALLQASAFDAPDICAGNWELAAHVGYPASSLRTEFPPLARHGIAFTRPPDLRALAVETFAAGAGGAVDEAAVEGPTPDGKPGCVRLSGWAVDPVSGRAADEVVLVEGARVVKRGAVHAQPAASDGRRGRWNIYVSEERWPSASSALAVMAVVRDRRAVHRLDASPGVALPTGALDAYRRFPRALTIDLSDPRPDGRYRLQGFAGAEPGWRWTDGREASITLRLAEAARGPLRLTAAVGAFVGPSHPRQTADILVNGRPVGRWVFSTPDDFVRELFVPADVVAAADVIQVTFRLPDAIAPASVSDSPDTRTLGLRFASFSLSEATGGSAEKGTPP